ncbi:hypothetical protein BJV78DRAFT_1209818, partial [Lactifluus subvellereus]
MLRDKLRCSRALASRQMVGMKTAFTCGRFDHPHRTVSDAFIVPPVWPFPHKEGVLLRRKYGMWIPMMIQNSAHAIIISLVIMLRKQIATMSGSHSTIDVPLAPDICFKNVHSLRQIGRGLRTFSPPKIAGNTPYKSILDRVSFNSHPFHKPKYRPLQIFHFDSFNWLPTSTIHSHCQFKHHRGMQPIASLRLFVDDPGKPKNTRRHDVNRNTMQAPEYQNHGFRAC